MRQVLFLIFFIFISTTVCAQLDLNGTVLSQDDNTVIPFATICLKSSNDSVQYRAITDLKGQFVFSNLAVGRYEINVSCMGYLPIDTMVSVRYPSLGGTTIVKRLHLKEDVKMLGEVVKTASSATLHIDGRAI